jgi:hypothetical protein
MSRICCICKVRYIGLGNNAWPIDNHGRCCDVCNSLHVIPARIKQMRKQLEASRDKSERVSKRIRASLPRTKA